MYHGLGEDFRPLDDPTRPPRRIQNAARYRRLIYGFAKASAILDGRMKDVIGPPRTRRRDPRNEQKVILPTGVAKPRG